jgi:proteasome accessory factor C
MPDEGLKAAVPLSGDQWFADGDVPSVVLRLAPPGHWAAERYPVREERDVDGALVVRMAVANEQWLRTLLLRLGPYAEVLEPSEWHELGAEAARQMLERYEATDN